MQRRRLLAAVPAAISAGGCLATAGYSSSEDSIVNYQIGAVSDVDKPLQFDVKARNDEITASQPGVIEVEVTNEGPDRFLRVASGAIFVFDHGEQRRSGQGLVLVPEQLSSDLQSADRPWTGPIDPYSLGVSSLPQKLPSGESFTEVYHLWDDANVDGYFSPGTHTFETEVTVSEDRETALYSVDLSMEIVLTEP